MGRLKKMINGDFVLNSNKIEESVMSRTSHLGEISVFKVYFENLKDRDTSWET